LVTGAACLPTLRQDPDDTRDIARKLSEAKGGRSWEAKPAEARSSREHRCSRACLAEWQRQRMLPENPRRKGSLHGSGCPPE
jgi:hypothetical protein